MEVATDSMVLFWQNDSIYSNWYTPIEIDYQGIKFSNSEALFMYFKAKFFGDDVAMCKILVNQDPKVVKGVGRTIKGYDDESWARVRFSYMFQACLLKFSQNEELLKTLLATETKLLVEASPYDNIWGIGLAINDPRALHPVEWLGANLLGEALMQVRLTLAIRNKSINSGPRD